jgi:hypothetical protein
MKIMMIKHRFRQCGEGVGSGPTALQKQLGMSVLNARRQRAGLPMSVLHFTLKSKA